MRETISWAVRQIRSSLDLLVLLAALCALAWLLAARGLSGARRVLWSLVPMLLFAAAVCWIGPGRLFPKQPFEGPTLLKVSHNHALTLLDVPGLLWAAVAIALAGWLLGERLKAPGE